APRKPFILGDIEALAKKYIASGANFAVLSFAKDYSALKPYTSFILSKSGNFVEAAKNLFSAMRLLDQSDVSVILAEEHPEEHFGKAINDRLRRAAAK